MEDTEWQGRGRKGVRERKRGEGEKKNSKKGISRGGRLKGGCGKEKNAGECEWAAQGVTRMNAIQRHFERIPPVDEAGKVDCKNVQGMHFTASRSNPSWFS